MTAVFRSSFRPQCGRIWSSLSRGIGPRSSPGLHRSRRVLMRPHTSRRLSQNDAPRPNIPLTKICHLSTPFRRSLISVSVLLGILPKRQSIPRSRLEPPRRVLVSSGQQSPVSQLLSVCPTPQRDASPLDLILQTVRSAHPSGFLNTLDPIGSVQIP